MGVKVHLILNGYALCNTAPRQGGYQATSSLKCFEAVGAEQCLKCAASVRRIRHKTVKQEIP